MKLLLPTCLSSALLAAVCCLSSAVTWAAPPPAIRFMVNRFSVEGAAPLTVQALERYFQPLQQRQYTLKELQDVSKGLEALLRDANLPFYSVILPPQTLDAGTVKFLIKPVALGEVTVQGNHYFSKDNIVASLPNLQQGKPPVPGDLSQAVKVANKHPAKQVQVTFKAGAKAEQVDAKINVKDLRPYQATLNLNTVGTKSTGNFRLIGALQYSNLWGLDHIVNASYTTSPDHADTVKQYGGSYSLPLYSLKGWLSAYYAYSNVNAGTIASDLTVTGSGEMYGIHYQQFLPKWGAYEQWLDIGLDNRDFVSDIRFQNVPIGTHVRSVPFSIQYKAEYPWRNARFGYQAQWAGNTQLGDHNSATDYTAVRSGASPEWNVLRYGANMGINLQQWQLQTIFIAQYTSNSLISGEQLGIGGSYDIRGYQERETSADRGEIVKIEATTPTWQHVNLFVFYDYGHGVLQSYTPGQRRDWSLSSTGVGAAWQWQQNLQAKVAYADALDDAVSTRAGDGRIHASIILRY